MTSNNPTKTEPQDFDLATVNLGTKRWRHRGVTGGQFFSFTPSRADLWRFTSGLIVISLPETNISPENRPLEKEIPIGNHMETTIFQEIGRAMFDKGFMEYTIYDFLPVRFVSHSF